MERIFNNQGPSGLLAGIKAEDPESDIYEYAVKAMIADAVDYDESQLSPTRENNTKYYMGLEPAIVSNYDAEYDSANGDVDIDNDDLGRSSVISTDASDTVMAMLPSLMRIFAASEHAVEFFSNTEDGTEMAQQATDYVRYVFWEDNNGFLVLHDAIKDTLIRRVGIVKWYTDNTNEVTTRIFNNITTDQLQMLLTSDPQAQVEIIRDTPPDAEGIIPMVEIKYIKPKPLHKVENVPGEEFRISRNAKSVETADLVGHDRFVRASELIQKGFDEEIVMAYIGESQRYTPERDLRNPSGDIFGNILNDLVRYGEYYVRIDQDGDGINELRKIHVIGDDFTLLDDYAVSRQTFAVFQSNPEPHVWIGTSPVDDTIDIQDINTNITRGALDSLTETIWPTTVFNEMLTEVDDVMSDRVGKTIRTRGDPATAVHLHKNPFIGVEAFSMLDRMDLMRQRRTGQSEASKGIDPKALQSTNVIGVDAIVSGAQERTELVARIIAETGLKALYKGLLQEIIDSPNRRRTIELRGKYTEVNPSLYDPDMRCNVNPMLGKGSDQTRMMTLMDVKETQKLIIATYGINNPLVGITEVRNTLTDLLELANVRNTARYFKVVTPETEQALASTPKEPDPNTLLAQAEMEKVKKDMVIGIDKSKREDRKLQMEDDRKRDELEVNAFLELVNVFKDINLAYDTSVNQVDSMDQPE